METCAWVYCDMLVNAIRLAQVENGPVAVSEYRFALANVNGVQALHTHRKRHGLTRTKMSEWHTTPTRASTFLFADTAGPFSTCTSLHRVLHLGRHPTVHPCTCFHGRLWTQLFLQGITVGIATCFTVQTSLPLRVSLQYGTVQSFSQEIRVTEPCQWSTHFWRRQEIGTYG